MKVLPQNCHQSDSRTTLFVRQLKCWRGGEVKGTNALSLPEVHPGNRMIGNRQYRVEGNGSSKVASSSSCRQIVWNEIRMYLSDKSGNSLSLCVLIWISRKVASLWRAVNRTRFHIYKDGQLYNTAERERSWLPGRHFAKSASLHWPSLLDDEESGRDVKGKSKRESHLKRIPPRRGVFHYGNVLRDDAYMVTN